MLHTKLKSSLVIISTLIIGMILGAIIMNSYSRTHFRKRIDHLRSEDGFIKRFEKIIEPNANQQGKVQDILKAHYQRVRKQSKQLQAIFIAQNDSGTKNAFAK